MTTNDHLPSQDRIDRRVLLRSLGGAVAVLAGCFSGPSVSDGTETPPTSPASQSAVFDDVGFDSGQLVVTLAADTAPDRLHLIGPGGELIRQAQVPVGATTVRLDFVGERGAGYTPGEHTLVAVKNDDTLGTLTLTLAPDVTIADVRWAKNHPDMNWEKSKRNWEQYSAVLLDNKGTAPTRLGGLRWSQTPRLLAAGRDTFETRHQVVLPPGETTAVYSRWPTFATQTLQSGVDCGKLETVVFTVTAQLHVGSNVSYSQPVTYGGEKYACELSLGAATPESTGLTPTPGG